MREAVYSRSRASEIRNTTYPSYLQRVSRLDIQAHGAIEE